MYIVYILAMNNIRFLVMVCSAFSIVITISSVFATDHVVGEAPPVITVPSSANLTPDEYQSVDFTLMGMDTDGDTLTWSISSNNVNARIDPNSGQFTWIPGEIHGRQTVEFVITLTDSTGRTDTKTLSFDVSERDTAVGTLAPIIVNFPVGPIELYEFETATGTLTAFDLNDDTIHWRTSRADIVPITSNGVFTFAPSENLGGTTVSVTFFADDRLSDNNLLTDFETLDFRILEDNPPIIDLESIPVGNDTRQIIGAITDHDGDILTGIVTTQPNAGTVRLLPAENHLDIAYTGSALNEISDSFAVLYNENSDDRSGDVTILGKDRSHTGIVNIDILPATFMYHPTVLEGNTIPSLSTVVTNSFEYPEDPVYRIFKIGDLPPSITESLNATTGGFSAMFPSDTTTDSTIFFFSWTFGDGSEESMPQLASITVNNNANLNPTPENEVPVVVDFTRDVLEDEPIPGLSTGVTNPPEETTDEISIYNITNSDSLPQNILDSFNTTSGDFGETFACDTSTRDDQATITIEWSFEDGNRMPQQGNATFNVIDNLECITSENEVPVVSAYEEDVYEGQPIPSLSIAVSNPPEDSPDTSVYRITNPGSIDMNMTDSLIMATGDFDMMFPCGTLDSGQTQYPFAWSFEDDNDEYDAPPSVMTLFNNPDCLTSENDAPTFIRYQPSVLEGVLPPSLSIAVSNPPENPPDGTSIYTITNASDPTGINSDLPEYIAASLDLRTGDFMAAFICDEVTTGDSITYGFGWTFQDGSEYVPLEQTGSIRALQNDRCGILTPQNERPNFRTYFQTARLGGFIPSLSMAVMDPEEDPADTSITYRIKNMGNLPDDIASSLDGQTGEFSGQFDDSYLMNVDSRSFVFTWSYQDDSREYVPRTAVLILAENSGGSSNDWKKKPTFGKSWEISSSQLVTDGFTFNDHALDISDNWHTEFRKISSIIGETNSVTLKAFSPDGFRYVTLSLGVPEIGAVSDAETDIILMLNRNYDNPDDYDITEIIHEQKESLVDANKTAATVTKVLCNPSSATPCYSFDIDFKVDAPLKSDVLAISAVDYKRRSTVTYINEGIEFTGQSLLAPNTHHMVQKKTNQGPVEMITLVQQDRRYNIWEDDSGYLWTQNDHGSWFSVTAPEVDRFVDGAVNVMTRLHSNFGNLMQEEREKATMMFNASNQVPVPDQTFSYDYSGVIYGISKMDKLAEELHIEQDKAQKIMELLK